MTSRMTLGTGAGDGVVSLAMNTMSDIAEALYYTKLIAGQFAPKDVKRKAADAIVNAVAEYLRSIASDEIAIEEKQSHCVIATGTHGTSNWRVFWLTCDDVAPALFAAELNGLGIPIRPGHKFPLDFVFFDGEWWSVEPVAAEIKPNTGRDHRTATAVILEAIYTQVATLR